jgi:hypothetical protein
MDVPARCLWEVPLWILRGFIAPRYDAPNRIEGMFFREGSSNRGQRGKDAIMKRGTLPLASTMTVLLWLLAGCAGDDQQQELAGTESK